MKLTIKKHLHLLQFTKINSSRVLLSLTTNFHRPLQQFYVKKWFLHDTLEEEVYIDLPLGFEDNSNDRKVHKLRKSLYGWNNFLEQDLMGSLGLPLNLDIAKGKGIEFCPLNPLHTRKLFTYGLCGWNTCDRRWCGRNEESKESFGKGIWN